MSVLFFSLCIFALVLVWVRRDRVRCENFVMTSLVLGALVLALSACSGGEGSAQHPTVRDVQWSASKDKGTVLLEVQVSKGEPVNELTLTFDRGVGTMDVRDQCVLVTNLQDNSKSTWMLAVQDHRGLLINISSSPLGVGTHQLVMEYRMRRDRHDESKDYWSTPTVVDVKATK
jgi:hypothetical protein